MPYKIGDSDRMFGSIADESRQEMKDRMERTVAVTRTAFVAMSSRQFASTKMLRKLGHPYGIGMAMRGSMPAPPQFINAQGGKLVSRFVTDVFPEGRAVIGQVGNTEKHGKYFAATQTIWKIGGTSKMRDRPTRTAVEKQIEPVVRRIWDG